MEKKDKSRFKSAMEKTELILPTGMKLNEREKALRMEGYWEVLEGYSIELVEDAFQWSRGGLKFFPTPKDLTDHISEERERRYLISQSERQKELAHVDWREPTPEGKERARALYQELMSRWDAEDAAKETKRQEEFERKRAILQKQRKLFKEAE